MHRLIIVLLSGFFAFSVSAAEVNDLYQSQAPVSSRDATERVGLLPNLLRQVLLKVTGDEATLSALDLEADGIDSQQFVQQYRYERTNIVAQDLTQPDQLAVVVNFNPNSVNNLLKQLGLPIWGRTRPDVLVWLAYQTEKDSSLLGLESSSANIIKPLTQAADNRGLPIVLPLMDLQDQTQLSFFDVWQGNFDAVKQASQRYAADTVVTVRISGTQTEAQIRWQTEINDVDVRWSSQGNVEQAITAGINELTNRLSRDYTQVLVQNAAAANLLLSVSDVRDYKDYSRLMAYLQRLDTISDVRVIKLNQQQLDLDIRFKGDRHILQRTLALGQMLVDEHLSDESGLEHYRLAP